MSIFSDALEDHYEPIIAELKRRLEAMELAYTRELRARLILEERIEPRRLAHVENIAAQWRGLAKARGEMLAIEAEHRPGHLETDYSNAAFEAEEREAALKLLNEL
jgi:sugar phosphate isomerase/epimerase